MQESVIVKLFIFCTTLAALLGSVTVFFFFWTAKKRERNDREREKLLLDHQRSQIEESERIMAEVSREVHDSLAHDISLIRILTHEAAKQATSPHQRDLLNQIERLAFHNIEQARDVSHLLNPAFIVDQGLEAMLRNNLRIIGRSYNIEFDFIIAGFPRRLPAQTALLVYRIAQEALHNTTRHANATRIDIELSYIDSRLLLCVTDNGKGFDPVIAPERGTGLKNMQARASLLAGKLTVNSLPGQGATIQLLIDQTKHSI